MRWLLKSWKKQVKVWIRASSAIKKIWDCIKWDEKGSRLVEPLKEVRKYTVEAIKELAQFAAMVDKTLETLEVMKIEDAKRENKDVGDAEVL